MNLDIHNIYRIGTDSFSAVSLGRHESGSGDSAEAVLYMIESVPKLS